MLALDPTGCKAIHVSGTGIVNSAGNVQANSTAARHGCGGIGFSRTGGGDLNVTAPTPCAAAAGDDPGPGQRHDDLRQGTEFSFALPDPLRGPPGAGRSRPSRRR